jgi:hypothetical protein
MPGDDAQRWRCARAVRLWPMLAAATLAAVRPGRMDQDKARGIQRVDLFVQAAEDAAVAALQPHDAMAPPPPAPRSAR